MSIRHAADGEILAGRFRLARTIKVGAGIRTWLASDLMSGAPVVVKTAPATVSSGTRLRLLHEAEILKRIGSQRLAPVLHVEDGAEGVAVVTPYISGVTLADRLASGPLSARQTLALAADVLEALRDAHQSGTTHGDLKPSNIIVEEAGELRATLIDFGLARSRWLDPTLRDVPAGTARYIAPEQAGLLDREVDGRADLYSLGVVLFECLAGQAPFDAPTLGETLRLHLTVTPPELRSLGISVPRALDEVVHRLLAKDPRDRYHSAEGALADVRDIADALASGVEEPSIVVGQRDPRRSVTEPAFVGREEELRLLRRELARARDGQGSVVLLEAGSGGGKTRLLEEFAQRAADAGARVLRGQGVDQAAQRPFEVLRGVAGGLAWAARSEPAVAHTIRERVAARADAVAAALPELREVVGAAGEELPEVYGETRTIEALASLLAAIGSGDQPAVVLLDDCQWADEQTLKLLAHYDLRRADEREGSQRLLIVVAFRTEEVPPGHALRELRRTIPLALRPLRDDEVARMVESMAGAVPAEAVQTVARLAEGSPFMVSAVLRGLVESGALVSDEGTWTVDPFALTDATASRRAAAFLSRRIDLLPGEAQRLLEVGAILGKSFDIDLAADLAGQDPIAAAGALEEARARHIAWARGPRYVFVHDKLRETVLGRLPGDERRRLHAAAGHRIEDVDRGRIFEIAYHYDAAGDSARALPYALEAAARARAQHALEVAQQQYEIAGRGAAPDDVSARAEIAEGLGDVLMLRGRYAEAKAPLQDALDLTQDAVARARIQGKIGELAFKRGDMTEAADALEQAMRMLGRRVPRTAVGFLIATVKEVIVQALHTIFPRVFLTRRSLEGAEAELVAIRLHSRLAHTYWFARGRVPTAWTHLREMNLAERYPPTPELAQAYSEHAPVATMIPWFRRGIAYGERSLAIRRDLGDIWGQGQSLHFLGVVLYAASRFEECIARCREAVRLLERTGDRWEVNTATWHIAFSLYRLGKLQDAVETARHVHRTGQEIDDAQARGISLGAWAKASGGAVPEDLIAAERQGTVVDVHTGAEVLMAEAMRLMRAGRNDDAVEVLEEARAAIRRKGLRQEYVAPVAPWLATARRLAAEAVPAVAPRHRRIELQRARRAARRAVRLARAYRNNLPHAMREAALIDAMLGRTRRARRLLEKSIGIADEQGARAERARRLQALGRLDAAHGHPGATATLADAAEILAEVEGPFDPPEETTLSLVDRFDTVLEQGRRIASGLSEEAIYAAVREAATTLLRGERCTIVAVGDDGSTFTPVGDDHAPFSASIVRRAVDTTRIVTLREEPGADASESLVLTGVRSALCAPIWQRGLVRACLYVEHRHVGHLFGPDEERLAGFITTLAGAALENAEGFAEVEALTRTLERRVEERTAELASSNEKLDASLAQLTEAYEREREATEQLRRLVQLKDEFVAMVAHDLRSPLTVIHGFATTLRRRDGLLSNKDRRDFLDTVVRNTRRLTEFVENLLEFARIESGGSRYDVRPFDLRALIERAVQELTSVNDAVRFDVRVPEALPPGLGDEHRQWQILTNLLSNALKFSPRGSPIEIEATGRDGMIQIAVRDHGIGIRPEDMPKLFEKFARLEGPDGEPRPVGTGLGLYICQSMIRAQGGRIWVSSTPGEGSTFTYTLPMAEAEAGRHSGGATA